MRNRVHLIRRWTASLPTASLLCLLHALPLSAAQPAAQWIAPPGTVACPVNVFTYLRKVVQLRSLDGDLTLHMAADSNARLWINGHIVRRKVTRFFEPFIATENIDAKPWLHRGANTVVLLHHSWGPIVTFQRDGCRHQGVYLSSTWIASDATWKSRTAEEYAANPEQIVGLPAGQGAHRIRFAQFLDGHRLPEPAIFQATYNDAAWAPVSVVANGPWPANPSPVETPAQDEQPVRPVLLLAQGRSLEQHQAGVHPVAIAHAILQAKLNPSGPQAISMPRSLEVTGEAGETRYITVDFGRPIHGYPFLAGHASGTAPILDFAYGELARSPLTGEPLISENGWLNPEAIVGQGYVDRYAAAPGRQRVELADERTARWWTLHLFFPARGRYRIDDLGFVSSQYPVVVEGSFSADDSRIAQVVRLSLEHARISMTDTYVDTPGREDGQWLEDARLRAELASEWFGDVRLRQLFLRVVAESQRTDGTFHPFPPSNYPIVSNADWVMEWVGALYDDYLWTGETTRVETYWPQVEAFWSHVLQSVSPSGLWIEDKVFADIRIGVHPTSGESSGIVTAQLIDRLNLSILMAKASGHPQDAQTWQAIRDRMLHAFTQEHLVPQIGAVPLHVDDVAGPGAGVNRGYSQAAQAMAISANLLPGDKARADLDFAFPAPDGSPPGGVDRWNNPTYLFRALDALSAVGLSERALQHLFERFAPYLPGDRRNSTPPVLQGAFGGPLPEYWVSRADLGLAPGVPASTQPIDATGSHGWNAVALVWLHRRLLGVTITTPGGDLLTIQPDSAGLAHIEGTTVTPHGAVHVTWSPAALRLTITLPPQVRARVVLPAELAAARRAGTLAAPTTCKPESDTTFLCSGAYLPFDSLDAARKQSLSNAVRHHLPRKEP